MSADQKIDVPIGVVAQPQAQELPQDPSQQLQRDLARVEMRTSSGRVRTLEGKILKGNARPDQIMEWYLSQDPLSESNIVATLTQNTEQARRIPDSIIRKGWVYEHAAYSLVKSCGWDFGNPNGLLEAIKRPDNPPEFYERLIVASDMLLEASEEMRTALPMSRRLGDLERFAHLPEYKDLAERIDSDYLSAMAQIEGVSISILENEDIDDPQVLMLGAEAFLKYQTQLMRISKPDAVGEPGTRRSDAITRMIVGLETVFLKGRNPVLRNRALSRSDLRGKLMELVWVLDSYVYLSMKGDTRTQVIPTDRFRDKPLVGHPQYKRGCDVLIRNTDLDNEYFVQLKSSPRQAEAQYHPNIDVVYEQNFQDVNPGRFHLKLQAYKKLIDSGYAIEHQAEAMRYILPSVVSVFSADTRHKNYMAQFAKLYGIPYDPVQARREFGQYDSRVPRRNFVLMAGTKSSE